MSDSLPPVKKVCMVPGCKDDGEDKQHWGKPMSRQKSARSPVVFAWAAIHQVLKLLGNLFLYPFSHVVEIWPGRPLGEGKWGVCLPPQRNWIHFLWWEAERIRKKTQSGLKSPTFCRFRSTIYSSLAWSNMLLNGMQKRPENSFSKNVKLFFSLHSKL